RIDREALIVVSRDIVCSARRLWAYTSDSRSSLSHILRFNAEHYLTNIVQCRMQRRAALLFNITTNLVSRALNQRSSHVNMIVRFGASGAVKPLPHQCAQRSGYRPSREITASFMDFQ